MTERTGEDKERVDASSRGKKNKPESLQASANISGATEVQADAKELIALRQEVERLRNELSQARHDIESSQDMVQSLQQQIVRNQRTAAEADAGDQEDSKALQQRLISAANAEQNSKILELWQEKGERDEEQDYVFWKQLEDLKKQSPEQRRALAVAREQLDKSQQLPGSTAEKLNSTEEDRNFESFARKRDRSGVADLGEGGASDGAERVDCEIVVDAQ